MDEKKKVFSRGRIEIERVIDEKGKAKFLVRFPQVKVGPLMKTYEGDEVFMTEHLVIDGIIYEPVVDAYTSYDFENNRVISSIMTNKDGSMRKVEEGEYLNVEVKRA